jgi:hypothetical protein
MANHEYDPSQVELEDLDATQLAWLQAAIDKGRASGVGGRDAFEVLEEIIAKRRAERAPSDGQTPAMEP